MLRRSILLLVLCVSFLVACSDDVATLEVRVFTGLVPGPEFRIVSTELIGDDGSLSQSSEATARVGMDYAHGQRVASFEVADDEYRVRVRLLRANGNFLVERIVRQRISGNTVLPVHITRDCVGVVCPSPGGDSELSTCLGGRCVDPRCSEASSEYCPTFAFCRDATQCRATSECASTLCEDGICVQQSIEQACDETAWCNPDEGAGCQPLTPATDGAFPCGTICTLPSEPCRFGYWTCEDAASPTCTALQNRPTDFVCDVGRVCDVAGDCVVQMPLLPGFVITPSTVSTSEDGTSDTFTVALTQAPTATVFLVLSSSNSGEASVFPSALAFTASNYATPQLVTVTGVNDFAFDGLQSFTIVTQPATSADERYNGLNAADVNGTNADNESAGVVVSPTTGLVTSESGGTATFTIVLLSQPTAPVTITMSSDDAGEGIADPSLVTFTTSNWSTPQTITVTGVDDALADDDQPYTIDISSPVTDDPAYAGLPIDNVSLTNTDDESRAIVINRTSGIVTGEGGASDSFTVALSSAPSASVTLSFMSADATEGSVSPAMVTFTSSNWSSPRTITVTGVDDLAGDGSVPYEIVVHVSASADAAYAGLADRVVSCTNLDNESPGITVTPTSGLFTSEMGASAIFSVVLNTLPADDVTITLASNNTNEGTVSVPSLTFTADDWDEPQFVTITGVNDGLLDGDIAYTIVTSALSSDAVYGGRAVADVSVVNRTALVQEAYVKASNTDVGDGFGIALAVSGDGSTMAVGAYGEASAATGVGGDQSDDSAPFAGAVYLFTRVGSSWTQQAYIKASNAQMNDVFGISLDLSSDGNVLAVGATNEASAAVGINGDQSNNGAIATGAVYVFRRTGSSWAQEAYVKPPAVMSGFRFGENAVAIAGDGNTLAVGMHTNNSDATGINGDPSPGTTHGSGAVYVFAYNAGTWAQQAFVKSSNSELSDYFGYSIDLTGDGNLLAVGAPQESSNASGIDGNQADNSMTSAGAVYLFTRTGTSWSQSTYVKASNPDENDIFGGSVVISADGLTLAVAARGESSNSRSINGDQFNNASPTSGAIYVFRRVAVSWAQEAYIKTNNADSQDAAGVITLSGNGDVLAVGVGNEDSPSTGVNGSGLSNARDDAGAVYVFVRSGATWTQRIYLKASNPGRYDGFSFCSVSNDGRILAVSAPGEGSGATGIDGDQADDDAFSSGAVYTFILE